MSTTVIRGGRVIDPANHRDEIGDVFVQDGCIVSQADASALHFEQEIDAKGLIVCPGLIDINTRMGEPNTERASTMRAESKAAISGGITSACIQPDTHPVVDTPAMAHMIAAQPATQPPRPFFYQFQLLPSSPAPG